MALSHSASLNTDARLKAGLGAREADGLDCAAAASGVAARCAGPLMDLGLEIGESETSGWPTDDAGLGRCEARAADLLLLFRLEGLALLRDEALLWLPESRLPDAVDAPEPVTEDVSDPEDEAEDDRLLLPEYSDAESGRPSNVAAASSIIASTPGESFWVWIV